MLRFWKKAKEQAVQPIGSTWFYPFAGYVFRDEFGHYHVNRFVTNEPPKMKPSLRDCFEHYVLKSAGL